MISDAFAIFRNVATDLNDNANTITRDLKNTTAISARAKSSFFTYPCLFSPRNK